MGSLTPFNTLTGSWSHWKPLQNHSLSFDPSDDPDQLNQLLSIVPSDNEPWASEPSQLSHFLHAVFRRCLIESGTLTTFTSSSDASDCLPTALLFHTTLLSADSAAEEIFCILFRSLDSESFKCRSFVRRSQLVLPQGLFVIDGSAIFLLAQCPLSTFPEPVSFLGSAPLLHTIYNKVGVTLTFLLLFCHLTN